MSNKQITYEGVKLHKGQEKIVKEILQTKAKFNILNCSRQYGKSVLASQLILYFAINNKNCRCLYGTPIHAQSKKVYSKILTAILPTGVVKEHNKSDMTITLINGSVMLFTGCEKYDNLRGESIDYMILDEFSFMRTEAFTEALRPMLLVRGKKCIIISTPKGRKNHFYHLAQLGQSDDQLNYSYHQGSYKDNPYYDNEEIEDARLTLPDYIFRQEYLGEFIDNGAEIFVNLDKVFSLTSYSKPSDKNYAGLDIGRQNDYTVLSIFNKSGQMIYQYRDRQKSWETIVGNVANDLKRFNASCLVEVNGIGDVVFEMLQKKYRGVEAWITTNQSKQQIIELMAVDFQNLTIQLPNQNINSVLYDELTSLEFEYNVKTRTIKYHAPQGLHDDTVMSTALANWNRHHNANKQFMIRG
jgi:PBSX family phage terminase large subunit